MKKVLLVMLLFFGFAALGQDCCGKPGDIDGDGDVDQADADIFRRWLGGENVPICKGATDVNCDGQVDIADLIYLYHYLYNNGPPPPACDCIT